MKNFGRHKVVINGDDFGISSRVNLAIVESFDKNLISSATIMANMPRFEEACALTHDHGLNGSVGVHLTLTEGFPLTDPIRLCSRLCNSEGEFIGNIGPFFCLTHNEKNAIEYELTAQVDSTIAHGVSPTHFDSHNHFHTYWPIISIVIRLANKYHIPAIRLTRNCGYDLGSVKRLYKIIYNFRLVRAGMAPTRHFGSASEVKSIKYFLGPIEIMVHPDLDECGHIIDITSGKERLEDISIWWRKNHELTNYKDLCKA